MSRICSENADVAYLFRPLGFVFQRQSVANRQRTCLLEHKALALGVYGSALDGASLRQFRQHLRHRKPMPANARFTSTPPDLSPDMIRVDVHFCRPYTVPRDQHRCGRYRLDQVIERYASTKAEITAACPRKQAINLTSRDDRICRRSV